MEELGEMILHQETKDAVLLSETETSARVWCPLSLCKVEPTGRMTKRFGLSIVRVEMEQWKAEELELV